jgi:hypothetical protein
MGRGNPICGLKVLLKLWMGLSSTFLFQMFLDKNEMLFAWQHYDLA